MSTVNETGGQCRVTWTIFPDRQTQASQEQSKLRENTLYAPPSRFDLNGNPGDATIMKKHCSQADSRGAQVIFSTNGLGSVERAQYSTDLRRAKEALKLKYKPGPILIDSMDVSSTRKNPGGANGLFFGTISVVASEDLLPGDHVMLDFSDPTKPAKTCNRGRTGTDTSTRRPLLYVRYTPTVPGVTLLSHVHNVLKSPELYTQLRRYTPNTANAWQNAVRFMFEDDMLTAVLAIYKLLPVLAPRQDVLELLSTDGEELDDEEVTVRIAQYLGAIPIDEERRKARAVRPGAKKFWEEARHSILSMKYFTGNRAYEFGYSTEGAQASSKARNLRDGKIRDTAEGNILKQQVNAAVRRQAASTLASDFSKQWVVGVCLSNIRAGDKGTILITPTKL